MPALAWSEIRSQATQFAREWAGEKSEAGEYQSFWNDFFAVFGLQRRSVAVYQKAVNKLTGHTGHIDLFWQGVLLAEHKSAGESLDAAFTQATDYFTGLEEDEKPRYIAVTDYSRMRLYDLEGERGADAFLEFALSDFPDHLRAFAFMRPGYREYRYKDEDPVNRRAVKAIGRLHDALVASNYPREATEKLLTRLVFCFFGDDTGAWEPDTIHAYLDEKTKSDGSDIGAHLALVFQILNQSVADRQTTADEDLRALPHVNGGLFAEPLPAIFGSKDIRDTLLECASFNWSGVSPAIFGSMFQQVMTDEERHDIGAHYTSEANIMKVIGPLFLDTLLAELDEAGSVKEKLEALWERIARITLLDPACGCGNFLVIAYRELRKVELEIIRRLHRSEIAKAQEALALPFDPKTISRMSVERMHGIELETFPAEIARLSLWLTDHIANLELGALFGKPEAKFPLADAPHILGGTNALTTDWESVVPKDRLTHIFGNPPFIGAKVMSDSQRAEIDALSGGEGTLDYVTGWYFKAAQLIGGTRIACAFVSTNSITQGEQVAVLWKKLTEDYGISIHSAHRTFRWTNDAPGKAAVYCVIVGFAAFPPTHPRLFDYEDVGGAPQEVAVSRINAYLVDAPDIFIERRKKPLCDVPEMGIGNKPIDGGSYLFSAEEKQAFLALEPQAEPFFRRWMGAEEFLNGGERWVLWLGDCPPEQLRQMPESMRRVEAVRTIRQESDSKPTQKLAETPTRFHVEFIPRSTYLLVPRHSSENRRYLPIGFIPTDTLTGDSCLVVPDATLYNFGVLESEMHMAWMRGVCGRLESRYRYSKDIVYNNFPWPKDISDEQKEEIEKAGQAVLDARAAHPNATLADLYDPNAMPKNLLEAHRALDRAVDKAYGAPKFASEPERLQYLFGLYRQLTETK